MYCTLLHPTTRTSVYQSSSVTPKVPASRGTAAVLDTRHLPPLRAWRSIMASAGRTSRSPAVSEGGKIATTRLGGHRHRMAIPPPPSMLWQLALVLCSLLSYAHAYIPATPSNDTSFINSESFISINYLSSPVSAYANALSRQLINVNQIPGYRVSGRQLGCCCGVQHAK